MNKVVVISGGTKGIGRAIAEKFAEGSYDVCVCARSENSISEMSKEWFEKYPKTVFKGFRADVSITEEVKAFADFVLSNFTTIDVIVNNAGQFIQSEVHTAEEGQLEQQIETNLYSAFYLTRSLISNLKENKKGHIFNMCSVASLLAYPNGGLYSISKFALMGFTKSLRQELMIHNIKVTAVIPGATWSDSWAGVDLPETRLMPANDIALMIYTATLLSDASVVEELIIRPQLGDL